MVEVAQASRPTAQSRQLSGVSLLTVRHEDGEASARKAVQDLGLVWPATHGQVTGRGPWLARVRPDETIFLAMSAAHCHALLQALSPGRSETAMAADLSEALTVHELVGRGIDGWLARVVDASAIPREPGRITRCRFADMPAYLLRHASDRLWLLADWSITDYVESWLAYARQGAFSNTESGCRTNLS